MAVTMVRPTPPAFDKKKIVAENRRARFEYFIEDVYEAGIALTGTEVPIHPVYVGSAPNFSMEGSTRETRTKKLREFRLDLQAEPGLQAKPLGPSSAAQGAPLKREPRAGI